MVDSASNLSHLVSDGAGVNRGLDELIRLLAPTLAIFVLAALKQSADVINEG